MTNLADGPSSDEEKFVAYGQSLLAAISASFQPWLISLVKNRSGLDSLPTEVANAVHQASVAAIANVETLVTSDIDVAMSGPLEQMRRAVAPVNLVLDEHGFERPARDPIDTEMRPHDVHDLGPMSFLDLGPEVHEAGIAWGAAKAYLHVRRRA